MHATQLSMIIPDIAHHARVLWWILQKLMQNSMHMRRWILQELKQNLAKELDFRLEASNAQRLSACMASRRRVAIPKPVPQASATSTLPNYLPALQTLFSQALISK